MARATNAVCRIIVDLDGQVTFDNSADDDLRKVMGLIMLVFDFFNGDEREILSVTGSTQIACFWLEFQHGQFG